MLSSIDIILNENPYPSFSALANAAALAGDERAWLVWGGRYPNLYVSAGIAATTGGQAQHIRNLTYELAHHTKVIENVSGARGSADRWAIRARPN